MKGSNYRQRQSMSKCLFHATKGLDINRSFNRKKNVYYCRAANKFFFFLTGHMSDQFQILVGQNLKLYRHCFGIVLNMTFNKDAQNYMLYSHFHSCIKKYFIHSKFKVSITLLSCYCIIISSYCSVIIRNYINYKKL